MSSYKQRVEDLNALMEYAAVQFTLPEVEPAEVEHALNVAVRMMVEQAEGDPHVVVPAEADERVMNFFHMMMDVVS